MPAPNYIAVQNELDEEEIRPDQTSDVKETLPEEPLKPDEE
jgi:hypothetical protein